MAKQPCSQRGWTTPTRLRAPAWCSGPQSSPSRAVLRLWSRWLQERARSAAPRVQPPHYWQQLGRGGLPSRPTTGSLRSPPRCRLGCGCCGRPRNCRCWTRRGGLRSHRNHTRRARRIRQVGRSRPRLHLTGLDDHAQRIGRVTLGAIHALFRLDRRAGRVIGRHSRQAGAPHTGDSQYNLFQREPPTGARRVPQDARGRPRIRTEFYEPRQSSLYWSARIQTRLAVKL
jgi:hypothetical protein